MIESRYEMQQTLKPEFADKIGMNVQKQTTNP